MESQPRQRVHRGEIWRVEVPTGVGSKTTGMRWALVISQKAHTKGSYTFNAVYLNGQAVKKCMANGNNRSGSGIWWLIKGNRR